MIFSVFQKNLVLGYSWSTLLWHWCYYLHRSRVALSPVCGIFWKLLLPQHSTCWILFDFDLHLIYFIMQKFPVTREWDEADWLDPLLCQPHLYLQPLLGFLKWLECLEVGFREVVRGLMSPTPFTESCVTNTNTNTDKSDRFFKNYFIPASEYISPQPLNI